MKKCFVHRGALWVLIASAVISFSVRAQHVGMVTDLEGKAEIMDGSRKMSILTEVDPDMRIQLSEGARMVVVYLSSGDEYTFKGPTRVRFRSDRPDTLDGEKPQKRSTVFGKTGTELRIKTAGMAQAAIVMRGLNRESKLTLLSLSGTKTLESRPEFRWKPLEPGLKYEFELYDVSGRALWGTEVEGNSLKLPPNVILKEGVNYTWNLSVRLPDHTKYSAIGEFTIASPDLRAQMEALRPARAAPLSERITYAAWLDQVELRDEARKYWRAAALERPDDPRLKALAKE